MATRSAANRNESVRTGEPLLQRRAAERAERRGDADERRVHRLDLAVDDVDDDSGGRSDPDRRERGRRGRADSQRPASSSSGTITIPPPTPNSALKNPAARPIRRAGHPPMLRPWPRPQTSCGAPRGRAGRDGALPRLRRGARADRRPAGGRDGAAGDTRRATRLAGRYGSSASSAAGRARTTRAGRRRKGVVYVGTHGLELDPEAEAWRAIHVRGDAKWPPEQTEDKGLSVAFHYRDHRNELRARDLKLIARAGGRPGSSPLRPQGARGAAAARREQGDGGPAAARRARADACARRGRRHHRPRRVPRRRRPRAPRARGGRVRRGAARAPRAADIVVGSTGEFLELLRRSDARRRCRPRAAARALRRAGSCWAGKVRSPRTSRGSRPTTRRGCTT